MYMEISHNALTLRSISGFVLSSPIVGYMTAAEFHTIRSSVNSKEKLVSSIARTTSAKGRTFQYSPDTSTSSGR